MKYLGAIADDYDLVNKKYVDDHSGGTVSSVAASGTGGITISGSPITTSGTLSIGLNLSTAINGLGEGTSPATIDDYAVVQYAGGGTTTTTYYRRKLSNLIVGKAVSDQNGLRIDTGYLKLTGGTLTGSINLKYSGIDASKTNNNVSSTVYPTTFSTLDNGNRILARVEGIVRPDGYIGVYLYCRNYNTSGTQVAQKGIQMLMAKDGTFTYTVSDPIKFTNAIGALPLTGGTVTGPTTFGDSVSIDDLNAGNLVVNGSVSVVGAISNSALTTNKLIYATSGGKLTSTNNIAYFTGTSTATSPATYYRLHIHGQAYGNTANQMISGTAGLFSFGDGGPQITFDSSATPGGNQAGALIFTDHDSAATGVSWHFVSNQSDWNVTSKRFHARTGISIGTNLPNTSYNLYVNGTTYFGGNVNGVAYHPTRLSTAAPNSSDGANGDIWLVYTN